MTFYNITCRKEKKVKKIFHCENLSFILADFTSLIDRYFLSRITSINLILLLINEIDVVVFFLVKPQMSAINHASCMLANVIRVPFPSPPHTHNQRE